MRLDPGREHLPGLGRQRLIQVDMQERFAELGSEVRSALRAPF